MLFQEIYDVTVAVDESTGVVVEEDWFVRNPREGKDAETTHRIGGPAVTNRDSVSGKIISEQWWHYGKQHRDNGPAVLRVDPNTDVVVREEWWRNDALHRDGGPALIERDPQTGQITTEEYWTNGRMEGATPEESRARIAKLTGLDLNRIP